MKPCFAQGHNAMTVARAQIYLLPYLQSCFGSCLILLKKPFTQALAFTSNSSCEHELTSFTLQQHATKKKDKEIVLNKRYSSSRFWEICSWLSLLEVNFPRPSLEFLFRFYLFAKAGSKALCLSSILCFTKHFAV